MIEVMSYDQDMSYPTLTEHKRAKVARMQASVKALSADLAAYAREHGGRYILFGSAARGELRHDSDVDVVADFPSDISSEAWDYAEERAAALGLKPDVHQLSWMGERLSERIVQEGLVLG